jgi:hypothetical protein
MTRNYWLRLRPSLLVAAGILASTFLAVRAAGSVWLVMAAPLLLALAIVGADVLDSRLRGEPSSAPSPAALLFGGSCLLAGLIVSVHDPSLVKELIPVIGATGWITLSMRPESRRKPRCNI